MLNNIKHLTLPQEAIDLYLDAWRPKTRRSYFVYLRKWQTLCIQKNWNKLRPTVNQVIYFLTSLFRSGLSYGSVNLARSALSSSLPYLDGKAVGQHPVICKILKGMYNRRPQQSRYSSTWDVDVVLEYIREMSPLSILPLRELTRKMVMFMLLMSCQRVQTLNTLNVSDLIWSDGGKTAVFRLSGVLKHSRRGSLGVVSFKAYVDAPRVCVVTTLRHYLKVTEEVRHKEENALLVCTKPPFRRATTATIARWEREALTDAGIDAAIFKAHSTRGAATSKLADLQVPVQEIMDKAAWSVESTFRKFYRKTILPGDVSHTLLSSFINRTDLRSVHSGVD